MKNKSLLQDELPVYFEAWNKLGKSAATLMEQHKLRDAVHQVGLYMATLQFSHIIVICQFNQFM